MPKTESYSFNLQKDSVRYYLEESKKQVYSDFKAAKKSLVKAEAIAKKSKDPNLIADVAHNYAASYYIVGTYDIALQKFMEALSLYEETDNKLGIAKCLIGQGLIQQGIGRNKEAIKLFQKANTIIKELNDTVLESKVYLNIGISQIELKEIDESYDNFHKSLKLAVQNKDSNMEHLSQNRLGNLHYLRNDLDSSVYYYKKVLDASQANQWEKSFANTGLSEVYIKKGDYKKAEEYGLKGFEAAKNTQAKWDIARAAEILSIAYKNDHNYELAFKYLAICKSYNDSLFNDAKLKEINLLQLKRKEAENEKLVAKNEAAQHKLKNTRLFSVSVILFMLYLLTIIYQYTKNNKVREKLYSELELKNQDIESQQMLITAQNHNLSELNQTKNKLFSILSHDLRSPIASIQQVLGLLREGEISSEELKVLAEHLITQVDSTSIMLNNILHWSMTQLDGAKINKENIDLEKVVKDSIAGLNLMAKAKEIKFIHTNSEKDTVVDADKGHVQIILNNLLSNAIKFTPIAGTIEIRYSEDGTFIHMHINDSGKGISQAKIEEILNFDKRVVSEKGTGFEEGTGLGLLLVKQFLSDNNGQLDIVHHQEGGTEFIASLPKAKYF
ncbi:phospho-acceptor domain-containing protein [Flavobacterium endophyticum]|uniref:histidine kinase n=1 Tax=Flavobacterium endophyticum TaxID=1540163 RepID=A0A495MGW4_9FLAO|nr:MULTISPECIES: tetratricopeptide repeat-containing sensor histidine kinase [Flavobacterium]RKS25221.1 phospho-acceptor domain-containing protein [Flavobacterium endophyticum]WDO12662.1 tetratricopeptide repeat-containing sensor histidine kinase [Flavobacterium sp. WW92]